MPTREPVVALNEAVKYLVGLGAESQNWRQPITVPNVVAPPMARQGFAILIQYVEGLSCMCACMSRPGATPESCAQECDCGPVPASKEDDTR